MRRLFRWGLRLFLGLTVLAALLLSLAWLLASRSLPTIDGTAELAGLGAPAEIVRDTHGVPHLFGETREDVFFALGYAHAQDRLWQMTMFRRTVQGRLSELFGTRTAAVDELLRRFDLAGAAEASLAVQSPEAIAALEAYAAGVNARIGEINAEGLGRGAPEFFLFTPEVALWRPADSLAIMKLMALQLSTQLGGEVLRARLALALAPERLRDILPESPGARVALDFAALLPEGEMPPADVRLAELPLSPLPRIGLGGASNAWTADGSRSTSGRPLLANDPHLELTAPSIWYLAHLGLPSGGVAGGTIPGIPAVLVGRGERLAWGLTSSYVDDQDLFLEELNPDDPSQYRGPDGWLPFRSEPSVLRVKDAPPRTITLRWTDNGPVLPGGAYDLATVTPPGHVMALSWTALARDDTTMTAALDLMGAGSVREAMSIAEGVVSPSQVLTLADRDGIGMMVVGRLPRRDPDHDSMGRLPSLGQVAHNRWQGAFPPADNPRFTGEDAGILGTTNNQIVDRPFPRHLSYDWGDSQRIRRLTALMQAREVHTREGFMEAQLDAVSAPARTLLPLIAADLWFTGEAGEPGTPERRRRVALDLLADWNGEMNEHLPEPLIYAAWMRELQRHLIEDDLGGPLAAELTQVEPLFLERVFRNIGGAAAWCDVRPSAAIETCTDIARMALDDALVWLEETQGGTVESLRWGAAHQATHDHAVLGQVPGLGWLVNIRQSSSGGDQTLMRGQTGGDPSAPFLNVAAAGYRGVYDMGDPGGSLYVIATGPSGHPLSRFYDNLADLWRRGEYIPLTLDPELARAGAAGALRLVPAPAVTGR